MDEETTIQQLKELFNKAKIDFSHNEEEYFARLGNLLGYKVKSEYKTIFVLASDISKENEEIIFKKSDKSGSLDDYFRLDAIVQLIKEKKVKKVLLVGGCNEDIGKFRTEAMRDYIKSKFTQEEIKNIELEEKRCCPGNTCGNIVEIVNYFNEKPVDEENVYVLTNLYHIPRIEKLVEDSEKFCKESYLDHIEFIPAEIVLNTDNGGMMDKIIDFYNQEEMKKRFASEVRGIGDPKYTCRKYLDCDLQ